jgi:hypothetical protein
VHRADKLCLEIWEPQLPGILKACPGMYRDCFTFNLGINQQSVMNKNRSAFNITLALSVRF